MAVVERYIVHHFVQGKDEVLGSFTVENGEICFPTKRDQLRCDLFPSGPMREVTKRRLTTLLNNKSKSVYLVHG
jgi:hypothetical protein